MRRRIARLEGLITTRWMGMSIVALAGCASYRPLPLPDQTALATDPAHVRIDAGSMPTATLRKHAFDPTRGLDIDDVAMLAVANNPDLKAARADAGVSQAQAFSAGLLPDPQFTLTRDRPMGGPPGSTVAISTTLGIDLGALLTRPSIRAAADADSRKTDLNLLWQEWQTIAKARLLFVKLTGLAQASALLQQQRAAVAPRLERTRIAVQAGLITAEVETPQLSALQDVERQANDLERQTNQARHDLNALLGLAPELELTLTGAPDIVAPSASETRRALADAPRRRPDLLALQAGYAAEDARYRGALRAQFPAITLGPNRARDTSNVNTVGFTFGITLPIFNRNQGNIAIELATREKLRLDYQQRLDSTEADAHRLLAEQAILARQRSGIDSAIDALAGVAARAGQAFTARSIDALTLTNAEAALLSKRLERVAVEQAQWEQAIALQALLGGDLPGTDQPGVDPLEGATGGASPRRPSEPPSSPSPPPTPSSPPA